VQEYTAQAFYNKAMVLRDADRDADAIAAFSEVVARYGAQSNDTLRRWAGMGQYNKCIHLARMGDPRGSVAAAEDMLRSFGESADPAVRERLAKALYSRALLAAPLGFAKESIEGLWDIERRFKDDHAPVVVRVVAAARRRERLTLAIADPSFDAASAVVDLHPAVRAALVRRRQRRGSRQRDLGR
jgi:hypothetical protein